MNIDLGGSSEISFTFSRRPEPVLGDLRPRWKVALVLLALFYCGRGPSRSVSLGKLKVLSWSSRNTESQMALRRFIDRTPYIDDILLRHEPALVRALNIAAGLGFITRNGESLTLTDAGLTLATAVAQDRELLIAEKQFFSSVDKSLTEKLVKTITEP